MTNLEIVNEDRKGELLVRLGWVIVLLNAIVGAVGYYNQISPLTSDFQFTNFGSLLQTLTWLAVILGAIVLFYRKWIHGLAIVVFGYTAPLSVGFGDLAVRLNEAFG